MEVWHLSLDPSTRDVTVSVTHSLYPRFSLLLKSLLAMTRVVPAYQLSRKNEDLKFGLVFLSLSLCLSLPPFLSFYLFPSPPLSLTFFVFSYVISSGKPESEFEPSKGKGPSGTPAIHHILTDRKRKREYNKMIPQKERETQSGHNNYTQ